MSIYSGFATRFQQQSYDHCIDSLLYILQKRIIKFYQNEQADEEKFIALVLKLHNQMKNMEKNKYLQPKSSQSVNQLIKFMQIFLQNTPTTPNNQDRNKDELPEIEPKPILPQVNNPNKKKSIYWVEKTPLPGEGQSSKGESERDMNTINSNNYDVLIKDGNIQFRKTSYKPTHLRGVKMKNSPRSNLSKQRRQQRQLAEVRPPKNRSISGYLQDNSGYLQDKPLVQSKITHYAQSFREETEHPQRRKNKSNHKINQVDTHALQQPDNQTEVADIIRQYIIKAKKNHLKGRTNHGHRDTHTKLNDF